MKSWQLKPLYLRQKAQKKCMDLREINMEVTAFEVPPIPIKAYLLIEVTLPLNVTDVNAVLAKAYPLISVMLPGITTEVNLV